MSGFITISGRNTHILNLHQSIFRLQKFLLLSQLIAKGRGLALFVLRPDYLGLTPRIVAARQSFASSYIAGVLTNYSYVGSYFVRNSLPAHYIPSTYPSALITIPTAKALNEARHTRTPGVFLADSSSNAYLAPYGVPGNPEFMSFKFLVETVVRAFSSGKRREKLLFAKSLRVWFRTISKHRKFGGVAKSLSVIKADIFEPDVLSHKLIPTLHTYNFSAVESFETKDYWQHARMSVRFLSLLDTQVKLFPVQNPYAMAIYRVPIVGILRRPLHSKSKSRKTRYR